MEKHSKACCSLPPVISEGYEPKGKYITLNGLRTYVTGPEDATKAIFIIYDIFGFFSQTLQGADILSTSDPDHPYRIFIPDFFEESHACITWYPPDTEEKQTKFNDFLTNRCPPPLHLPKVPALVQEANKLAPAGSGSENGFSAWAVLGHCWGGKIATLLAGKDSLFKAAVQCHPAMVDGKDAENVTIPMAMLASMDEPVEDVKAYKEGLKVPHLVDTWPTQIHGWMAARADLKDEEVKREYENGYKVVLGFLREHMDKATSKI